MMHNLSLILYYALLAHLPMHPFPGGRIFNRLRLFAVRRIVKSCGEDVLVKSGCYFGNGKRLSIGDRSQLGQDGRLNGSITIGKDVLMGQEVIMMATSHRYTRTDIPIMAQGEEDEKPIVIGNGVWIGTRAIILPGVEIGHDSIVGAGAVVTKSCPAYSIIGGVPAKFMKSRLAEAEAPGHDGGGTSDAL